MGVLTDSARNCIHGSGMHIVGIADLQVENARQQLRNVGWPEEQFNVSDLQTNEDTVGRHTKNSEFCPRYSGDWRT